MEFVGFLRGFGVLFVGSLHDFISVAVYFKGTHSAYWVVNRRASSGSHEACSLPGFWVFLAFGVWGLRWLMLRVWVLGFGIFAWERGRERPGREGERARERERDREREGGFVDLQFCGAPVSKVPQHQQNLKR